MLHLTATCDGPSCKMQHPAINGNYPPEMIVIDLECAGNRLPHELGLYAFCGGACLSEWARRVDR